jgi:hypothetical protein
LPLKSEGNRAYSLAHPFLRLFCLPHSQTRPRPMRRRIGSCSRTRQTYRSAPVAAPGDQARSISGRDEAYLLSPNCVMNQGARSFEDDRGGRSHLSRIRLSDKTSRFRVQRHLQLKNKSREPAAPCRTQSGPGRHGTCMRNSDLGLLAALGPPKLGRRTSLLLPTAAVILEPLVGRPQQKPAGVNRRAVISNGSPR